jgi:hypothetical protein
MLAGGGRGVGEGADSLGVGAAQATARARHGPERVGSANHDAGQARVAQSWRPVWREGPSAGGRAVVRCDHDTPGAGTPQACPDSGCQDPWRGRGLASPQRRSQWAQTVRPQRRPLARPRRAQPVCPRHDPAATTKPPRRGQGWQAPDDGGLSASPDAGWH